MAKKKVQDVELDDLDLVRLLAWTRLVLGAALFVAPRRIMRSWVGDAGTDRATSVAARGMAARDVTIAFGTLRALEGKGHLRGWVEAGAIGDAADTLSTIASRGMPAWRRFFSLAVTGAAAVLGFRLASSLDD
ncbi:MAG: hypothetical protein M3271_03420 [Actinomycetota bacterium]|nr:hypothetical protein [Actinomycetota bacterium]